MRILLRMALAVGLLACVPIAAHAGVIVTLAQWNFNQAGSGAVVGPSSGVVGGTMSLSGGVSGARVGDATSPDPAAFPADKVLRTTNYPTQGTANKTAGAEFEVSTAGYKKINVSWNALHSAFSANTQQFQYSLDGGATWNDFGAFTTSSANTWQTRSVDLTSVTGVTNNGTFATRIVSAFGNPTSYLATNNGTAASYQTNGSIRTDMFTVTGQVVPEPATLGFTGLIGVAGLVQYLRRRRKTA